MRGVRGATTGRCATARRRDGSVCSSAAWTDGEYLATLSEWMTWTSENGDTMGNSDAKSKE